MNYTDNRKAVICSRCNEVPRKNNSAWCHTCTREYRKARINKTREILKRYKLMKGCSKCGYKDHPAALQFNHIDPSTKVHHDGLSRLVKSVVKWQRIKDEVAKCEILCANCHAKLSYEQDHHLLEDVAKR